MQKIASFETGDFFVLKHKTVLLFFTPITGESYISVFRRFFSEICSAYSCCPFIMIKIRLASNFGMSMKYLKKNLVLEGSR